MPRVRDIGWQHGKMIDGHRNHIQCNYCHRIVIGGVTRFKKHLASKRGEIKGCETVPQDVKEMMQTHLATGKMDRVMEEKQKEAIVEALDAPPTVDKDTESDDSERDMAAARLESLRTLHGGEAQHALLDDHQHMARNQEAFDAISIVSFKDEQILAPPRATDPGWAHGIMINGDRQKIKCRYCQKIIQGGGISRLKQHLAGERGNIAPCERVTEDVKLQMQQHLGFKVLEKQKKQKESEVVKTSSEPVKEEGNNDDSTRSPKSITDGGNFKRLTEVDQGDGSSKRKRVKKSVELPVATPLSQPNMHLTFASQESIDQADMAVAKFMYDSGITFSAANSPYFQLMADAICAVGPGYKMPSYYSLREKLLDRTVSQVQEVCHELRKSWEVTGCSVIADRWEDKLGHLVINFFVYCPKGTAFLRSVDFSNSSRTLEELIDLFDNVIQDVGPKNIVHFLTDTTPNFRGAGKMLAKRYKTFFWSACTAHCIDLIFEELCKMPQVEETFSRMKKITQFIYNRSWVLNLMRKMTGGKDIVRTTFTKHTTSFFTLQSIMSLKDSLHQMFTSTAWIQSPFFKQKVGAEVSDIVLDPQFWSTCANILNVCKPLITVLHTIYGDDRPSMGYIYDAMEKAKKGIIVAFNNKESDYLPYLRVIDHVLEEQLHSPLHAAAYYLNPSIFYNPSFSTNKVIQKSLLDCIETLVPDLSSQDMITKHIAFYENAVGDFNRPVALRGRESLAPATWWSLYASDYPDLQRFAVRILSQTCSGFRLERDRGMFERIYSEKKNRLESKRLNDFIFVHYNLHLQERQSNAHGNKSLTRGVRDPICLEGVEPDVGEWVEDQGMLEREDLGWNDADLSDQ